MITSRLPHWASRAYAPGRPGRWAMRACTVALSLTALIGPSTASTPAFHGRALIVGINHYDDDNIMSLHFSGADAKLLAGVLAGATRGIFDPGSVSMLSDGAHDADT